MTVAAVLAVCGTAAGVAVWKLGVGPSCCTTPGVTVTQYSDAVMGSGYLPQPDKGLARIIACSKAADTSSSNTLLTKTALTTGARPDKVEAFPDETRDGPGGSKVVRTKVIVTVSAGGTMSYNGWVWFDFAVKPRDGRWCVQSVTWIEEPR